MQLSIPKPSNPGKIKRGVAPKPIARPSTPLKPMSTVRVQPKAASMPMFQQSMSSKGISSGSSMKRKLSTQGVSSMKNSFNRQKSMTR